MINEFQRSIRRVLNERIVSPLLGSLSLSWIAWNWQILYFLLSDDPKFRPIEKIEFVTHNLNNFSYLVTLPIVSALSFTLAYPFLSILVTFLWEFAVSLRKRLLESIRRGELLTIEESLALRSEINAMEDRIKATLASKDTEIRRLSDENAILRASIAPSNLPKPAPQSPPRPAAEDWEKDYTAFKRTPYFKNFGPLVTEVASGTSLSYEVDESVLAYAVSNELITPTTKNREFTFTDKGRYFAKRFLAEI